MKTKINIMRKTHKAMTSLSLAVFYVGEMDKSRDFYSREGDNSGRSEEKAVPCEHTIGAYCIEIVHFKNI